MLNFIGKRGREGEVEGEGGGGGGNLDFFY